MEIYSHYYSLSLSSVVELIIKRSESLYYAVNIFRDENHERIFLPRKTQIHSIGIEMHNPLLNGAPIKVSNFETPAKC